MFVKTEEPPKKCSRCDKYEALFHDDTYYGFKCNSLTSGRGTLDKNLGRLKECPMIAGRAYSKDGPRPKKEDLEWHKLRPTRSPYKPRRPR